AIGAMLVVAALHSARAAAAKPEATDSEIALSDTNGDPEQLEVEAGQADAAAAKDVKPELPPEVPAQPRTHPIRVTGRALDPDGKSIPGAKIYLASLAADWKRLAETETDEDGWYEFRDVPLPIEQANVIHKRDAGAFEIFGQAEGFGFAW